MMGARKHKTCALQCYALILACLAGILFCEALLAEGAYVYDSRGRRDPFVPLIGEKTSGVESIEDVMSIDDVVFQGTGVDSSGRKIALVNNEMIAEGQTIGRVTAKKILENKLVLLIDNVEYKLSIYEEEK